MALFRELVSIQRTSKRQHHQIGAANPKILERSRRKAYLKWRILSTGGAYTAGGNSFKKTAFYRYFTENGFFIVSNLANAARTTAAAGYV